MTRVTFTQSEATVYARISTEGHSGYAEEGSDIICAAVSSATELVVNILEQFGIDLSLEVDEEEPSVNIVILESDNNCKRKNDIKRVAEGYKSYVSDLADAYPEYVTISTEV